MQMAILYSDTLCEPCAVFDLLSWHIEHFYSQLKMGFTVFPRTLNVTSKRSPETTINFRSKNISVVRKTG